MVDMIEFDSRLTSSIKSEKPMYTIVTSLTSKQLPYIWNRFIVSTNRVRTVLEIPSDYYMLYLESGLSYTNVYKSDNAGIDTWFNSIA